LDDRRQLHPLVYALGVHLEGPEGDARLGAHPVGAPVNGDGCVRRQLDRLVEDLSVTVAKLFFFVTDALAK
jgi:hypothetical protein